MGDQLALDLEPRLPGPPETLRPMLPQTAPAPFDSPDHLFEPSWRGRRALAFLEPAAAEAPSVRLLGADGRDLAPALPELAGLATRVEARSAVLDGELVVVDRAGHAVRATLDRRLAGRPGPPVSYLVFDLLFLDGRPLLAEPLHRRRERLARVLRPGPAVVAVPAIAGEGRALHDAVTTQGIAGMLARVRTSPYLPGVRSRLWRFVAAGAGAAGAGAAEVPEVGSVPGVTPILALIRRLPLDEE